MITQLKRKPIQDPTTPGCDWNGNSDTSLPSFVHAVRNRMWQRQIEPHVKIEERPESASNQSRTCPCAGESAQNAMSPMPEAIEMATRGRPLRSIYRRNCGAWPCSAKAAKVRDDPKTDALPTERTAMRITAFIIDGKPSIPAFVMEMTKGDAAVLAPVACRSLGSV